MKVNLLSRLSEEIKTPLRPTKYFLRGMLNYGKQRWCPICQWSFRKFLSYPYALTIQEDALCPYCGSLARHRFTWLFLQKKTDLFNNHPKRILHISPERNIQRRLKKHFGENYLSIDLHDRLADQKMDVTDLKFSEETFDAIICSHVLEYVPNDSQAISEIYRVLKRDGWAILITGIWAEPTIESSAINNPFQRVKIFGRDDIFVRQYGADYRDRIRAVGFDVEVISVNALVSESEAIRMGLIEKDREMCFCFCKKN